MIDRQFKREPHPLLAQLGGHWDKPFAKLPKKLHAPVRGVFSDAQWDRLDAGRRRLTVSELTDSLEFTKTHRPGRTDKPAALTVLRPRGGSATETRPSGRTDIKMTFQETRGENATASWQESPVLDKCMERESIDQFTFKVLTGCGVGRHGDFIVSSDGVRPVPIDAVVLDRLDDDQREVIDELLALNLIFPCTPTELVVFVDAAQGAFSLPDGYAEKVRSQPAVADAAPARGAEQQSEQIALSVQPVGGPTKATLRQNAAVHKCMAEVWNDYMLKQVRDSALPEPKKGEMYKEVANRMADVMGPRKKTTLGMVASAARDWVKPPRPKLTVAKSVEPPKRPVFKGAK